jgi:methyl-accepting chemotaxis protein
MEGNTMRWSIGSKIGAGFAVALTALVVIGAVSYGTTTRLVVSLDWLTHSHRVLDQLEALLSTMDNAETGQRGFIITGKDSYLQPYEGARDAAEQKLKDLRELTADSAIQERRLDALEPLVGEKFTELQTIIDLRRSKGLGPAAQAILTNKGKDEMDAIRRLLAEMQQEENGFLAKRSVEEKDLAARTESTIVLGSVLALAVIVIVGVLLTGNIAKPLRELSASAQGLALGDLAVRIPVNGRRDEVGMLAQSFMEMTDSLRRMAEAKEKIASGDLTVELKPRSGKDVLAKAFGTMKDGLRRVTAELLQSVNVLSSSAQQIVATTAQVASGASQTATAVSETTTTVEEVKQTAELSTRKARFVSEIAQKAVQVAETGKKSVDDSVQAMKRIRDQVESIAESVVRLSEQGQAIGEIMVSVNDLAEQSNLLAVNASIEAAKAGDHGKGFAVVAQEVRSLAEQSKQATAQVRSILNDIQKATARAVTVTEQAGKAAEAGVKLSAQAGESVQALAENVLEAAQAATQIAASSQQQMVGMDQVALAMDSIKTASAQNVASTKQMETAAQDMQNLGEKLKELVGVYKI